jgi:hypothetical protein
MGRTIATHRQETREDQLFATPADLESQPPFWNVAHGANLHIGQIRVLPPSRIQVNH